MKTTKEDFEFFQDECKWALRQLSLNDWKVTYKHEAMNHAAASVEHNASKRHAVITLATVFNEEGEDLRYCAFHEIAHLLSACYYEISTAMFSKDYVSSIDEGLANRIATVLINLRCNNERK